MTEDSRWFSLVLVALVSPLVADGDFQRGISFYRQGQYAKAAAEFEQLVSDKR